MKDILAEKIDADVKLHYLQIMQGYYAGRMDYAVCTDLIAKLNENKKKLTVLVEDTGDLTIRQRIETQQYPYKYYMNYIYDESGKD